MSDCHDQFFSESELALFDDKGEPIDCSDDMNLVLNKLADLFENGLDREGKKWTAERFAPEVGYATRDGWDDAFKKINEGEPCKLSRDLLYSIAANDVFPQAIRGRARLCSFRRLLCRSVRTSLVNREMAELIYPRSYVRWLLEGDPDTPPPPATGSPPSRRPGSAASHPR